MKKEKTKIWLGEDGVIRVKIEKDLNGTILENILLEFKEISKKLPEKPNVSIDITTSPATPGFIFRKKIVEIIKDALKNPGFNKVAEWGKTSSMIKTITMFIIGAINIKNYKYFETEEKALKWLKEK
jgi:hypothetical protein